MEKTGLFFWRDIFLFRRQDMALAADFSAFVNDQLSSRNMDFSLDITCWSNLKMILDIHITIHISCNRHQGRLKSIPQLSHFFRW